jgi:hypothetical protein
MSVLLLLFNAILLNVKHFSSFMFSQCMNLQPIFPNPNQFSNTGDVQDHTVLKTTLHTTSLAHQLSPLVDDRPQICDLVNGTFAIN